MNIHNRSNSLNSDKLISGLESLPKLDQALVVSHFVLGMSIDNNAQELGKSPEEVQAKTRQALMQLKNNVFNK